MPVADVPSSDSGLISRQVRAMALAWSRGERVLAEDVLAQFSGLGDEEIVRLIYEEVALRREAGEDVATTEVINRYPLYKDELEVLLGCDRMLRPFSRAALLPGAPGELGPFRLLAELGRGASGVTYLAEEPALGGRLVVLKVIPDDQEEHLSLARLQHTNIIPLYSETSFPDRGLRALCMPYLGGASLARLIDIVSSIAPAARRGRHLLEALDRAQAGFCTNCSAGIPHADAAAPPAIAAEARGAPAPRSLASDGPYRRYLERASYAEAVCWIVACLADGLENAHAHGLVHLDVKPSNILIAGDGLPMLLDFHLARRPIAPGEIVTDRLGGTPGWMAPEHRSAMDAVNQGESTSQAVDRRADIFGLGRLLREALCGPVPEAAAGGEGRSAEPSPQRNPQVSVGLADIIRKCLATRAPDRYPSAAALASDLRRHLNDLPLQGVTNRSPAEAWRKWRRRRPAALSRWAARLAILSALAVVICAVHVYHRQRLQQIATAVESGKRLRQGGRFAEAIDVLGRAIEQASAVPAAGNLKRCLDQELAQARRGQRAATLHELAERVRFGYGVDKPPPEEAEAIAHKIGVLWSQRGQVLDQPCAVFDAKIEASIRGDLLDLATAWAALQAGASHPDDGLRILDEAEESCGASPQIELARRLLSGSEDEGVRSAFAPRRCARPQSEGRLYCVKSAVDAQDIPRSHSESLPDATNRKSASSALAHYLMGCADLRSGRFREAASEFDDVLAERPQDFWPNFYAGVCAYRLGRFGEALSAFRVCVALAPESAECYFNRARTAEAIGHLDEAARDYDRAIALDPSLMPALLNRAALAHKKCRYAEAIADLGRALGLATGPVIKSQVQYNLALSHLARGDRAAAFATARAAATLGHRDAAALVDRLRRE
jgi:serine/threonine protein kinase/Flp pilus assembly protein TadD